MGEYSRNVREVTAQRCYDIWAIRMGVFVPWEHVETEEKKQEQEEPKA